MTLLTTAGFPPTAGPLFTTDIVSDYEQNVSIRSTGKTIGTAGTNFFGVGASFRSGDPDGATVNNYYPVHAASASFM
jgi:hypothetical protein